MGASMEVEPCVKGSVAGHVLMDAFGMVQGLSQLANLPDPPTDAIQVLLSSVQFDQTDQPGTASGHVSEQLNGKRKTPEKGKNICELCSRTYANKWGLKRHVEKAHPVKRKRLVETEVFECEECEYMCASHAALETHWKRHNSTEKTKSPRSKCAFCDKECIAIYDHYITKHKIESPEQIMFDNGNVLVHSSINPDKGKAPWFLKEKEKMNRYTDVTCRLCEAEPWFENREILESHYVMNHMVDPNMLENLKHVFRAKKGAHLIHLPASQPPKRRQSDIRTPIKKKVSIAGNEHKHGSKVNFERNDQASEPKRSGGFPCQECNEVYTTEALLNKHRNEIHVPKTENKTKQKKYQCCFCNKYIVGIYKHYGKVHDIDNPEQILFNNGNVLVRADIDTKCGQAPWFKTQKEKAENKYTPSTCRLCEADFSGAGVSLDRHYLKGHKVDQDVLKRLDNLQCMFRADNRAHLADLPTSTTKAKPQRRASSFQSTSRPGNFEIKLKSGPNAECDSKAGESEQNVTGLIIYQCAECGVAATTCDASIEHAQLHHFPLYTPIPQTCSVCQFSFEAQCFADHTLNHLNNNEYKIVKFHPSKLLDNWSDMFEGLSETHAGRIQSSSTYQHTRRVKMNSNMASGIPLYQCGKCEQYVRPKDVEGHCYNNICMENQDPGHFCSECEIYFFTSVALTEHEKDHKTYGPEYFRTVTFNCMEDELINRALQNIQKKSISKESSRDNTETQQMNRGKEITILENSVVSVFCDYCKKSIIYSEFEAHAATHNQSADSSQCEENQRTEEEPNSVESNVTSHNSGEVIPQTDVNDEENQETEEASQERNNVDSNLDGHNSGEVTPQTDVNDTVTNGGGTVEPWNSDTESCSLLAPVSSFDVRVEVHVEKQEDNDTNNYELQDILDEFSEEMANDLKHDIQLLRLKLFGMTYIPDENINNEELVDAKSESTEHGETSDDNKVQNINDKDKLIETTENELNSNDTTNTANQNANDSNDDNDIIIEIINDSDSDDEIEFQAEHRKSGAKPSSRDILTRMLSSPKKNV
ncbi:uncharacterized protein LOC134753315 [Cydia strobilella]|uniref:uncharacterized protein LOC134753315 n=1 Tax=Cydia strobilella TaxID=1100964 RepID=UPI0030054A93